MSAGPHITIITWHYVRDGAPDGLHARSVGEFDRQLDHIAAAFYPVTVGALLAAIREHAPLPENSCLLTFDDGYRDHYETVFPRLAARGWQGVFFPVVRAAARQQVLDVNRIQFALAAAGLERIVEDTREAIDAARTDHDIADSDTLYSQLATPGLHNSADAMFIKRALQTALPEALRADICAQLFRRHVSADEADFATELYAGPDELREMADAGMTIGGHGERHQRMNALPEGDRIREFEASRTFLESLGVDTRSCWTFCYPYGAHDAATVQTAQAAGCTLAFTLEPRIADVSTDTAWALPRIDTNELPH